MLDCYTVYPTLSVPDVRAACEWYVTHLDFELRFYWNDPPTHGAVSAGGATVHFYEAPAQPNGNWLYFQISDLETYFASLDQNEVQITRAPQTYPWRMREFNMLDLNGYALRFGQQVDGAG